MSVAGHTPASLQAEIYAGLVGQTITGMATIANITITKADDEADPTIGPRECADGGVTVTALAMRTLSHMPNSAGSAIQWMWEMPFLIRLSVNVGDCRPDALQTDALVVLWGLKKLVTAKLTPTSGANRNLTGLVCQTPKRHPVAKDFYLFEIVATLKDGDGDP